MNFNKILSVVFLSINGISICANPVSPMLTKTLTDASVVSSSILPLHVGVIDTFEVMNNSVKGAQMRAAFEKRQQEVTKELMVEKERIEKEFTDFKAKSSILSESARKKDELRLRDAQLGYQQLVESKQNQLTIEMQELTGEIATVVEQQVQELARQHNFDLVFDSATGRILYHKASLDLTKETITLVDAATIKAQKQQGNALQTVMASPNSETTKGMGTAPSNQAQKVAV
jgi:Skp family chaperone for outer membrane proteins